MKLKSKFTASLLAFGLSVAGYAQTAPAPATTPTPAAPSTPAEAAAPQFTEAQLLETFGWFIGKRIGLAELGFSKEQTDSIMQGVLLAAAGKESPYELEKIGPEMDKLMQRKQQEYLTKLRQQSQADTDKLFAEIKAKPGVVALPSGLLYEVVQQGTGEFPKPTDVVKVHYTGKLVNGTTFDSSVDRGEPAEFALNEVIPGWTEGIQKVNKGGKIKLYIPPHLAYGDDPRPGIPPSSTLIFDVEVIDVKAASAATPAAPATPGAETPAAK